MYTLVMASLMITGGRMGAILGRKRAFTIGCVIYACGSMTTALAPNLAVLLFGWSFLEGVGRGVGDAGDRVAGRLELREGGPTEGVWNGRGRGRDRGGCGPTDRRACSRRTGRGATCSWARCSSSVWCCSSTAAPPTPRPRRVPASTRSAPLLSALGLGLIVYGILRLGDLGASRRRSPARRHGSDSHP